MSSSGNTNDKDQKHHSRFRPRGLVWIMAFGIVLCIGVFLLSRSFDKRTEQYTFLAPSILNVLILIAIAAQAWIYEGQWNAMERQTSILNRSVKAAEDSAKAAKTSADALINSERAWITVEISPPKLESNEDIGAVKWMHVVFNFGNSGKTVARITDVRGRFHIISKPEDLPSIPDYSLWKRPKEIPEDGRIVVPGKTFQAAFPLESDTLGSTDIEVQAIKQGFRLWFAYGIVTYLDFSNTERVTQFCFVYKIPKGFVFRSLTDEARWDVGGPAGYNKAT